MANKTLKTVPKISVKIWNRIIPKFDAKISAACLRRDAYLTKVLEVELGHLEREVSVANSQAAYDCVFDHLAQFDRKLVSLALPPKLSVRLNEICERKRIVRDAFFNRLLLLLAATPQEIDLLFFDNADESWRTDVWSDNSFQGPFFQNGFYPLQPTIDPFWALRCGITRVADREDLARHADSTPAAMSPPRQNTVITDVPVDSVYTRFFNRKLRGGDLIGMNCYMPDWLIPGSQAAREAPKDTDALLLELGGST